jgi:hypothetical protein
LWVRAVLPGECSLHAPDFDAEGIDAPRER